MLIKKIYTLKIQKIISLQITITIPNNQQILKNIKITHHNRLIFKLFRINLLKNITSFNRNNINNLTRRGY